MATRLPVPGASDSGAAKNPFASLLAARNAAFATPAAASASRPSSILAPGARSPALHSFSAPALPVADAKPSLALHHGVSSGASTPAAQASGSASPSATPSVALWHSQGILLSPDWSVDIAADECGVDGVAGESPILRDIEAYVRGPNGIRVGGSLSATTYQIKFTPSGPLPALMRHFPPSYFCLPVSSIRRLDRVGARGRGDVPATMIDVVSKDVRVIALGFRDEATAELVESRLRVLAYPAKADFLFAFYSAPTTGAAAAGRERAGTGSSLGSPSPLPPPPVLPGWDLYDPRAELQRLGVLSLKHPHTGEALFRATEANKEYGFCPTYPSVLVFPAKASEAHMSAVAAFRSKSRVPALTWVHPANKTSLWRCSQPKVGVSGKTCPQDEQMLQWIREANVFSREGPRLPLLVADCRPKANALANNLSGGGFESYAGTDLAFMNIHNIHAVREAHRRVEGLALAHSPSDASWAQQWADTQWPYHLRTLLSAGLFVAEAMHRRGQSVLVHCSDGWDRTAQVCGLVQLMLDPYSRTLKGFCVLVAKEWCSFGHKFSERAGHGLEKDDGDVSPVFIQFLDAVWQLVRLFPSAFEFDARLLLLLAHHMFSCRFGTFVGNCERERVEMRLPFRTPSLWGHILGPKAAELTSPSYDPCYGDALLPHPSSVLRNVTMWSDWFLRWAPLPSSAASCRAERYPAGMYDRAALEEARQGGSRASAGATDSGASTPASTASPLPASSSGTGVGASAVAAGGGGGGGSSGAGGAASEPSLESRAAALTLGSHSRRDSGSTPPISADGSDAASSHSRSSSSGGAGFLSAAYLAEDEGDATADGTAEDGRPPPMPIRKVASSFQ